MSALWQKQAIIYAIDPETFSDGDGDGIGDFQGLNGKLDHLAGLNVHLVAAVLSFTQP